MSQARARSFQTAKSLNYSLYKVCSGTHTSRSYCSDSSFKALSSVKKFSTLNSAATNESFHLQNSCGYGSKYDQHPNGFYRETLMGFRRNFRGDYGQSYNIGEHGLHRQSQYNASRSYSSNGSSNQHISGTNYQIPNAPYTGMTNSQVPNYSQPNEKSDEAGEKKRLPGMLDEFDASCKERKLKEAVEVLDILEQHNVSLDIPRYLFLMNECGESQALQEAQHVHDHLTSSQTHLDVYIHNKILKMYSKCGSMEDAYDVFVEMPHRNLTSWDTMITGLAKNGQGEDAIEMLTKFKRVGLKPDNQVFHGVFIACSVVGDMKEGLLHFESMIKTYNLVPSIDDYVNVVHMLGSSGYLNEALEFIENMPIEPSVGIWETMMNQSRIHGDIELEDRCVEIVNLLDPSSVPIKPLDNVKVIETKWLQPVTITTVGYTNFDLGYEKVYSQLRCLAQPMKEAGYVPNIKVVLHDVDQESKEAVLLSHSERVALSKALLISPARAKIKIFKGRRVCADCHNAFKIISKLVGRVISVCEAKRFHHYDNGVSSCEDYFF